MSKIKKHSFSIAESNIAVIGLGYVGLPLAVEFGKYNSVIGYDINKQRILELKSGNDLTLEVDPKELKTADKLLFTDIELFL